MAVADLRRLNPRIWHLNFLALASNHSAFKLFWEKVRSQNSTRPCLIDIGCGSKPYSPVLEDCCYIGTDFDAINAQPDVVALNSQLPFVDNTFDGAIVSETLEHTLAYDCAVQEIRRVVKNRGYIYLSVPFVHPLHHHPYDFQRITEYKLFNLFKDDEMVLFKPSNTIFSTWLITLQFAFSGICQLLPGKRLLTPIMATMTNITACSAEALTIGVYKLLMKSPVFRKKMEARICHPRSLAGVLTAFPCGYAVVVRICK